MPIKPVSGEIKSQELNDNFSYLDSTIQNIDKGSPKGSFSTYSQLVNAYPSGDESIYVVQEDGHWYFWDGQKWKDGGVYQAVGIANKSVKIEHLKFVEESTNLLNRDTELKGYVISSSGELSKNKTYCTSEYIPVNQLENWSSRGIVFIAFYKEMGQFLSRGSLTESGQTFGIPSNVNYIRVSYQPGTTSFPIQLNKGPTLLPYEKGFTPIQHHVAPEDGSIKRRKLEPALSGFNNNNTGFIFQDGLLVGVSTKENEVEISFIEINYDQDGNLINVVENEDGMQVTTSLIKDSDGNVIGTANNFMEGA